MINEFCWGLIFGLLIGGLVNFVVGFFMAMREKNA